MTIYCKVTKGPLHAIFTKFFADVTSARKQWMEWGKQHGVESVSGHACKFKGPKPKGWRKSRRVEGAYIPDERTKTGKERKSEMIKLPIIPCGAQLVFSYLCTNGKDVMQINSTGTPAVARYGKEGFMTAIDEYWLPKNREGIKEITASEFKKLWEVHGVA